VGVWVEWDIKSLRETATNNKLLVTSMWENNDDKTKTVTKPLNIRYGILSKILGLYTGEHYN